jgi:hypothetical protein
MADGIGFGRATWAMLGLLGAAVLVTLLLPWQVRSRAEQVADALEAAPLVAVAAFPAAGHARIEGHVRLPGTTLIAPLSGQRCGYYELDIEVDGQDAAGHARRRASRVQSFELADATGSAVVLMRNALVAIDGDLCRRGVLADLPRARRAALSVTEDLGHLDRIDPATVRFRECVLPAGAHVAVAGVAGTRRAGRSGLILGAGQAPIYVAVSAAGSE